MQFNPQFNWPIARRAWKRGEKFQEVQGVQTPPPKFAEGGWERVRAGEGGGGRGKDIPERMIYNNFTREHISIFLTSAQQCHIYYFYI